MNRQPRKKLEGLTYELFRRRVKGGQVEPLYLFVGEEDYLHQRGLHLLYETLDEATRGFNISVFNIDDSNTVSSRAVAAIDAANQLPMMGRRRIVVVRDIDKIKDEDVDVVLEYLKRPASTASVVFQSHSLDQRRKTTTALLKTCTLVLMERPTEPQLNRWVVEFLKRRGCEIDADAAGRLLSLGGSSLMRLSNEMEKLAAFAGGGHIDLAAVEALVPRAKEHSSFEIWNAMIDGDRTRAVRLTRRLLEDGADPVMIVGLLAGLFRRMLAAKDLLNRGARPDEIARATGQYGPRAGPFNKRVKTTPREEILRGLLNIARVDNAIKNSEGTPSLQVEYLVAKLTLPAEA